MNHLSFSHGETTHRFDAVIFDFDGVIMDTEKYHYLAWQTACKAVGTDLSDEEYYPLRSTGGEYISNVVAEKRGAPFTPEEKAFFFDTKHKTFARLTENLSEDDLIRGVIPFLDLLSHHGIRIAVASSAAATSSLLEKYNLKHYFSVILDGNTAVKKKPAPDIFLTAAEKLHVKPERCLVFEDSIVGVKAALAAGMQVIVVGKYAADAALFNTADFSALKTQLTIC